MNQYSWRFPRDGWDDWSGIHNLFERWESWEAWQSVREETKIWAEKVLEVEEKLEENQDGKREKVNTIGITVPKWEIVVRNSSSSTNERSTIYANIWDESVLIWYTNSESFDNGKNAWMFFGQKGTAFEGVAKKFDSKNQNDLNINFRKWMFKELAKKHPDDYEPTEEEIVGKSVTSTGIVYEISGGTSENESRDRYISANIWSEEYYFQNYWFTKKWNNYIVWIKTKGQAQDKTKFQLKKHTEVRSKSLKDAVGKMLRKIELLLKSNDKKKRELADEIRKYIK